MKVGDYVRTKNKIYKIIDKKFDETILVDLFQTDIDGYLMKNDIIKSSPNIIDLIQVGDFVNYEQVNGGYVLNKNEDSIDTWAILPNSLKNEDIKSVITREQMKSLEYKVKE